MAKNKNIEELKKLSQIVVEEVNTSVEDDLVEPEEQDFDSNTLVQRSSDDPEMVGISKEEWLQLEKEIKEIIDKVIEDRQPFLDKLEEYQLAIQGIPEPGRKGPWQGSCKLRDSLTGAHCRIIETGINRTVSIDRPFVATVEGDKLASMKLQGLINTVASNDLDFDAVTQKLSSSSVRKGFAVIVPEWERRVKRERDYELYHTLETYKEDFPSAEEAKLSKSEYKKQLKRVKRDIAEQGFHEAIIEYDAITVNKAVWKIVQPPQFIMHPYSAPDTDLAQLLGYEMKKTYHDLKMMERDGRVKWVDRIALLGNETSTQTDDVAMQSILDNKGMPSDVESLQFRDKIFRVFKGIYRKDLYKDGMERDYEYIFVYEADSNCKVLLRFAPYGVMCNERGYFVANILPEDGTVCGTCIPELLENAQATLDVVVRLLIDSNSIANVPIFKGTKQDQKVVEEDRRKGIFYPGRVLGLTAPQHFEAFKNDRIDATAFTNIMRYVKQESELMDGASRTLAGQNLPDDPEAPGVKMAMQITQSNFMVNEYIKNLRNAIRRAIRFTVKLYRQNTKFEEKQITVQNEKGILDVVSITRDDMFFLEGLTKFDIKNQKIEDSTASRQMAAVQDIQLLLGVPQVAENPIAVRALVKYYLSTRNVFNEDEINEIIPTMEQIQQMFRAIAQDVLAAERAQQEQQDIQQQREQMTERGERDVDTMLRETNV